MLAFNTENMQKLLPESICHSDDNPSLNFTKQPMMIDFGEFTERIMLKEKRKEKEFERKRKTYRQKEKQT